MKADGPGRGALWLAALLVLLLAVGLQRPLLPIDETRYAAVAWEMWTRGDFLLPVLNGEPYPHKPPLLFWLMHAGWALFGVGEAWPRLISPLFTAGTLLLTAALARQLWPSLPVVARMAPFILLSSLLYSYFATALMFDAMLAFFVALGLVGLARARRSGAAPAGFMLLTAGLAGALYSKGPVALLHLLPLALLAPLWMRGPPEWRQIRARWLAGVLLSLLGAAALILAWAVPAAMAGGTAYRDAIFWGQTAGRLSDSFSHRAAWWFYVVSLPVMLAPWLLWPRWWHGLRPALRQGMGHETGWRFAVLGALLCLLVFSLVSGKRWQYLLPEFPLFALILARVLASPALPACGRGALAVPVLSLLALGGVAFAAVQLPASRLGVAVDSAWLAGGGTLALACAAVLALCRPATTGVDVRRVATATVVAVSGLLLAFAHALRVPYDLSVVAQQLSRCDRDGRPLAVAGPHHGQWTFAGRLQRPPQTIAPAHAAAWLAAHPAGRVVLLHRQPGELPDSTRPVHTQPHRGAWLSVLAAHGSADCGASGALR